MYEKFYKLREMPFTISTDPRFIWWGKKHREAMANLQYGLLKTNGYVVLTGDVGTGKTTMLNALIHSLDQQVETAVVNNPTLTPTEFFNLVCHAYGLPQPVRNKADFLFCLDQFLQRTLDEGKTVLLIIDEAHCLSGELLEEIRLLTNMEKEGRKLLNIFFVGQNEFEEMIREKRYRSLHQRVTLLYEIEPLTMQETASYIRHRLRRAGSLEEVFLPEAQQLIFLFSNGYPRLINILCDRALLTGYVQDCRTIGKDIIEECAGEVAYLLPPPANTGPCRILETLRQVRGAAVAGTLDRKPANDASSADSSAYSEKQGAPESRAAPSNSGRSGPVDTNQRRATPWQRSKVTGLAAGMAVFALIAGIPTIFSFRGEERGTEPQASSGEVGANDGPEAGRAVEVGGEFARRTGEEAWHAAKAMPAVVKGGNGAVADVSIAPAVGEITSLPTVTEARKTGSMLPETSSELQVDEQSGSEQESTGDPERPTPLQRALLALERQEFRKAIEIVTVEDASSQHEVRQYREVHAKALVGLAHQYFDSAPEKAVSLLRQAVELAPDLERPHFLLGKLLTGLHDIGDAIASYETVLSLNPELVDASFNLGFLHARAGEFKKAEVYFARVVELSPPYLDKALFNLALVQGRLGKRQESIDNLRLAVEAEPNNTRAREHLQRMVDREIDAR